MLVRDAAASQVVTAAAAASQDNAWPEFADLKATSCLAVEGEEVTQIM